MQQLGQKLGPKHNLGQKELVLPNFAIEKNEGAENV